MGYLNNVTGYREDILSNRSVIQKGNFALIEPDGLVKNVIPGFENCDVTILSSPKIGASFVDYLVHVNKDGGNRQGFGEEGVEVFVYVIEGELKAKADEEEFTLNEGGYLFCPSGVKLYFENKEETPVKLFLYKRRYDAIEGHEARVVSGNANDIEFVDYEGMKDVGVKDLLPTDLGFDMNFHILSFQPGGSHGYIETHFQEHGAYILSGQGMYNLDNNWIPVKKGDYLFMGAYSPQAAYAVGRDEPLMYVYSKDCNRDAQI
nr:(S)-ureidoglycine aminohydrolase [Tissierella sp.]